MRAQRACCLQGQILILGAHLCPGPAAAIAIGWEASSFFLCNHDLQIDNLKKRPFSAIQVIILMLTKEQKMIINIFQACLRVSYILHCGVEEL